MRARGRWLPLLLLLAACGGDGRTPLTIYSPHGRDLLDLYEPVFEAAHPAIDLRYLDMGSQEVYDRVRSERANPQGDVWFGGPATIFARAAAEGLLAPYRPAWADAVPPASRAPGDLYFGTFRTLPVLAWNSRLVTDAEAPRDWDDLLAPRFAGKLLIRDPMASGLMRTVFAYTIARSVAASGSPAAGYAWLGRLDAATKEYVANPALLFEKLLRGEGEVTVWELTDVLLHRQSGDPIGFGFLRSGTPVIHDSIGLVAGAPHREAATAFLDWAGSAEAQRLAAEHAFRLPARLDLPTASLPAWAQDVLARLVVGDYDRALAAERGPEWMATWDASVRGQGSAERAAAEDAR